LWDRVRPYSPDLIGGPTLGADPLTVAMLVEAAADGHSVGGFTVRRRRKRYGLRRLIEGQQVRPGSSVVLVDDMLSSGESLLRAHDAVASAGGQVVAAAVLLDGRRGPTLARFSRLGVPVMSVFSLRDLGLAGPHTGDAGGRTTW
jgi:orotate phosphoribosyltransferase